MSELSEAAREVYREVRQGILALRTQVGVGRSLKTALDEYLAEYELHFDGTVTVGWDADSEAHALTPVQEVQIVRIVQEALANVRKHAGATEVAISLTQRESSLEIEVKDNGRGFNPSTVGRSEWPHFGLQTMRERAEAAGGEFEIQSEPGQGTLVRARLPVPASPRSTGGRS